MHLSPFITMYLTGTDSSIHLGRTSNNQCSGVQLSCQQCDDFPTSTFTALEDATFVTVIGPSANPRGYTGITGDLNINSYRGRAKAEAVSKTGQFK